MKGATLTALADWAVASTGARAMIATRASEVRRRRDMRVLRFQRSPGSLGLILCETMSRLPPPNGLRVLAPEGARADPQARDDEHDRPDDCPGNSGGHE